MKVGALARPPATILSRAEARCLLTALARFLKTPGAAAADRIVGGVLG
jgi:hypothetical protein